MYMCLIKGTNYHMINLIQYLYNLQKQQIIKRTKRTKSSHILNKKSKPQTNISNRRKML